MKFQAPKGTKDFLPEEMVKRQFVIDTIRNVFERYGFDPLETPVFEEFELLAAKSGEDVKNQIYKFEDKSGRELGLRFDLTIPMARVVANNPQMQKPFKRYAIAPAWRYEEITASRKRQFYQSDIDVVGSTSMEADIECIAAAIDCLKELGFKDFIVTINNRKILDGFLEVIKVNLAQSLGIFRAIDKLKKFGQTTVIEELIKTGLEKKQTDKLLDLISESGKFEELLKKVKKILAGSEIGEEGIKELEDIRSFAESFGISKYLLLDFSLARGLDYYTGPIFEIAVKGYEKVGSIAGGGRYDTLIEIFGGRPSPATGISLGIERVIEILNEEGKLNFGKSKVKIFVANVNEKVKKDAIKIAQKLRAEGINCQTDLMNRSLGKQLEYSDNMQIPFVVIIGEKELKVKKVKIRNMKTKQEKEVTVEKIKDNL